MSTSLCKERIIVGIAVTDDVTRRGDRFLLSAEAVCRAPVVPVVFADQPELPVGEVFRIRRLPESLLFSALIDDTAPHWQEICDGLYRAVAIGFRSERCHLNAFGGVTYDRWRVEEITLMPPSWPAHDPGAQLITVSEGGNELCFAASLRSSRCARVKPRSTKELKRLIESGNAQH